MKSISSTIGRFRQPVRWAIVFAIICLVWFGDRFWRTSRVIQVGTTADEVEQVFADSDVMRVASGLQAGSLIGPDGKPESLNKYRFFMLPDRRCVQLLLSAQAGEPIEDIWWEPAGPYRVRSIAVGPPLIGYGGKFRWLELPKTHPTRIDVGKSSWVQLILYLIGAYWIIRGVIQLIIWRLGVARSSKSTSGNFPLDTNL